MGLSPGVRLGAYEVIAPLGQGGMGEVYRARDVRLGRTVALKILPPELARDPESREQLRAEAHAIASLSHPNICALHDIGSHDGIDFLVMELVDGETLAARLRRGPIPFEQVLRTGIEIARALDAAHAQGVVHRDVTPGNVMLTKAGAKLLDFGISTFRRAGLAAIGGADTQTVVGRPGAENVVGTLRYMAPEQVEGDDVDARADIFALGAVLYESATGRKAFDAEVRAGATEAILERDPPPMRSIRPAVPEAFDRLVRRCLAKDREERWQSARDVLFQLLAITADESAETGSPTTARIAWSVAALAVTGVLAMATLPPRPPPAAAGAGVFHISLPPGSSISPSEAVHSLEVSPNGRHIAFTASRDGRNMLWMRSLDALEARPLPGTEDARMPFWSPDSKVVGFFAAGRLQRIDPAGGPPLVICEAPVDTAPTWGRDGTILFALTPDAAAKRTGGIYRVAAEGGPIEQVTVIDPSRGESEHFWPHFLPDGVHFLYVATISEPESEGRRHTAFVASIRDATVARLEDVDSRLLYAPPGYLLYSRDGALLARRFDLQTYRFTGDPVLVADRLWYYKPTGMAQFSVSETGLLAYHGGLPTTELRWFDRTGRDLGSLGSPAAFTDVRISRDGQAVAVSIADPRSGSSEIWIYDRASGIPTRSTAGLVESSRPVWSGDGQKLYLRSARSGPPDIYEKRADGRGATELTIALDGVQLPLDATPDGRMLVYLEANRKTGRDIWLLPLVGVRTPRPYLRTSAVEHEARVSSDGRWLAFASSESGRGEIYVAPIDDPGGRQRVSTAGGLAPRWSRDGRELLYLDPADTFMSVPLTPGPRVRAGPPRALFSPGRIHRNPGGGLGEPFYDLAPDGQTFLVNRVVDDPAFAAITVMLDWEALLE